MDTVSSKSRAQFHYIPELPVKTNPLFDWPFNPVECVKWLAASWLKVSTYILCLALAVVVYFAFLPSPEVMQVLSLGWIVQVWLCNLLIIFFCAGALHYYFYILKRQGRDLKYEARDQDRNSKIHTFGNQVHDNMFWTLGSGVFFLTAYEVVYFWLSANGYVPTLMFVENPIWFIVLFPLIPIWSSVHFYWVHRLLHWPPLYRVAHALHHRNVNIGPWSGISMHPIEHVLYFSSLLIHIVVASHPVHILFHMYFESVGAATSHTGFEGLKVRGKKRVDLGTFYHQLHHKHFKCNYGNIESPWDRWFGSYHDGTDAATKRIRKRKW